MNAFLYIGSFVLIGGFLLLLDSMEEENHPIELLGNAMIGLMMITGAMMVFVWCLWKLGLA